MSDTPQPMDPNADEAKVGKPAFNHRRTCYAIQALVAEVRALFPETVYKATNYDRRGTALSVTFMTDTTEGLGQLLELVRPDVRVLDVSKDSVDPSVTVTFRSSPRLQDLRDTFNLAQAWAILSEGRKDSEGGE